MWTITILARVLCVGTARTCATNINNLVPGMYKHTHTYTLSYLHTWHIGCAFKTVLDYIMSNHVLMKVLHTAALHALTPCNGTWILTEAAFSLMSSLVPLKHLMSKYFKQVQRYNCLQYLVMTTYSVHLNLIYSNLQMFEKHILELAHRRSTAWGPLQAWIFDNYPTPWCRQCQEHGIDARTYGLGNSIAWIQLQYFCFNTLQHVINSSVVSTSRQAHHDHFWQNNLQKPSRAGEKPSIIMWGDSQRRCKHHTWINMIYWNCQTHHITIHPVF